MTHNIRIFEVGGSIRDELMGIQLTSGLSQRWRRNNDD